MRAWWLRLDQRPTVSQMAGELGLPDGEFRSLVNHYDFVWCKPWPPPCPLCGRYDACPAHDECVMKD
jgi:hypothetical protein